MKRLCLILAYLFLFSQTASAMPLLVGQKVVYRGTVTGLRISAVDGTAFIDNAGATIPTYADGNHQIEIYDSSNRMLRGVLKAAGTSETLGDEKYRDTGFDDNGAWTKGSGWTVSDSAGIAANTNLSLYQTNVQLVATPVNGALYKMQVEITSYTSGQFFNRIAGQESGASRTSTGTFTDYLTFNNGIGMGVFATLGVGRIDNVSAKQVLTPSSSGATITTLKNGDVYNWSYKNSSFSFNSASYYVIIRAIR